MDKIDETIIFRLWTAGNAGKPADPRSSRSPTQKKHEEKDTKVHHDKIAQNQ